MVPRCVLLPSFAVESIPLFCFVYWDCLVFLFFFYYYFTGLKLWAAIYCLFDMTDRCVRSVAVRWAQSFPHALKCSLGFSLHWMTVAQESFCQIVTGERLYLRTLLPCLNTLSQLWLCQSYDQSLNLNFQTHKTPGLSCPTVYATPPTGT